MDNEVNSETSVTVPIGNLFADLRERLAAQDQISTQRLNAQDNLLRRIDKRLDDSATKEDVRRIEATLQAHETRFEKVDETIDTLRVKVHEDQVEKSFRQRIKNSLGWFIAAVMVPLGAALIIVVATHK